MAIYGYQLEKYICLSLGREVAVSLINELLQDETASFAVAPGKGSLNQGMLVMISPHTASKIISKYLGVQNPPSPLES